MRRLMVAALHSGAGKTAVTCALLAALKKRGLTVSAFKCGPDYIDPMFHTRVLGVESRNLDLFLQGPERVQQTLCRAGGDIAVIEGAMGFYDGIGGTDAASAWAVAEVVDAPVVLIVRPQSAALTLAAQIKGVLTFRPQSHIAGLLLNDCKPSLSAYLTPILQRETGLPVLGSLPHCAEAELSSRHLGLYTAAEIHDLSQRCAVLGNYLEQSADLDALLSLAAFGSEGIGLPPKPAQRRCLWTPPKGRSPFGNPSCSDCAAALPVPRCRIAVARDEAFCFYYADSLDALRNAGAELCFFSPMRDAALPEQSDGLYLGGGYPELYARALSENVTMRQCVAKAVGGGMPTVAECGGFLYLQETLLDETGHSWPMTGALPGEGFPTGALCRFGYLMLTAQSDSLLFRRGEQCPAHEFHYWDSTQNGGALRAQKPLSGRQWRCGVATDRLYAAFPHLHLDGPLPLAARFVDAAAAFFRERSAL